MVRNDILQEVLANVVSDSIQLGFRGDTLEYLETKEKAFKLIVRMIKEIDYKQELQDVLMPTVVSFIEQSVNSMSIPC